MVLASAMKKINGPARLYLYESNLEWNKTKILVIPCDDEVEAYNLERQIQIKHNLFNE
jgi:hypothetical protein